MLLWMFGYKFLFTFNSFGYILRSGIAGSYYNSVFNSLRVKYTILPSHHFASELWARVPVSPRCWQYSFPIVWSQRSWGVRCNAHRGFAWHFPNGPWRASSHVLLDHSCSSFGERSMQVLDHLWTELFIFLSLSCCSSLYILNAEAS